MGCRKYRDPLGRGGDTTARAAVRRGLGPSANGTSGIQGVPRLSPVDVSIDGPVLVKGRELQAMRMEDPGPSRENFQVSVGILKLK